MGPIFSCRSLLCRPLPVDVGRCTCIIVKESSPDGFDGGTLYTLYTNVREIAESVYGLDFSLIMIMDLSITCFFGALIRRGRVGKTANLQWLITGGEEEDRNSSLHRMQEALWLVPRTV